MGAFHLRRPVGIHHPVIFLYLTLAIVLILEFLPHEGANYVIQGLILSFMICLTAWPSGRDIYNYLLRHHLRMARIKVGQIVGGIRSTSTVRK